MWRLAAALLAVLSATAAAEPAYIPFGAARSPTSGPPVAIGGYSAGCIAGAAALPIDGPHWQAMRLSRGRNWGHPLLLEVIGAIAEDGARQGWPGLLVGDLGQPRGGPMLGGHASHQIGLDADIWLTPMPPYRLSLAERETFVPVPMLLEGTREIDPAHFGAGQRALIESAARRTEVARIFVHPAIKAELCTHADAGVPWLRKVRPWWGHDRHLHIRLACPEGDAACRPQEPPPAGDGCGADLAWWLGDEPWQPKPAKPTPPLTLADLPAACAGLVAPETN